MSAKHYQPYQGRVNDEVVFFELWRNMICEDVTEIVCKYATLVRLVLITALYFS